MELSADPPFMQRFPQEKCRSEGTAVRQEREQSNGAAWAGRPLWKAGNQSQDQVTGDSCLVVWPRNLEFDLSRENGVGREQERGF